MSAPYPTIYPKVQKENYVWGVEKGYCGNHQEIMRNEAGRTHRWESVQGSRPYVCSNCAQTECIRIHVVSEREKCPDDF